MFFDCHMWHCMFLELTNAPDFTPCSIRQVSSCLQITGQKSTMKHWWWWNGCEMPYEMVKKWVNSSQTFGRMLTFFAHRHSGSRSMHYWSNFKLRSAASYKKNPKEQNRVRMSTDCLQMAQKLGCWWLNFAIEFRAEFGEFGMLGPSGQPQRSLKHRRLRGTKCESPKSAGWHRRNAEFEQPAGFR